MEPLDVTKPWDDAPNMAMERGRAMGGEIDVVCLAKRADLQKSADASATRGIGLQYIDGTMLEQPARIVQVVDVLARSDIDPRSNARSHQPKPIDVVRCHRLLEPTNA